MWRSGTVGLLAAALVSGCGSSLPTPTPNPPLVFSPDTLAEARIGVAYDVTISVSQARTPVGDIFLSKGTLPAGLALTFDRVQSGLTGTARIGGTPTGAGSYALTVSAWCYGTMTEGQGGDMDYVLVSR
jgi:hypothetical protein